VCTQVTISRAAQQGCSLPVKDNRINLFLSPRTLTLTTSRPTPLLEPRKTREKFKHKQNTWTKHPNSDLISFLYSGSLDVKKFCSTVD